jgi:hypothetical protein
MSAPVDRSAVRRACRDVPYPRSLSPPAPPATQPRTPRVLTLGTLHRNPDTGYPSVRERVLSGKVAFARRDWELHGGRAYAELRAYNESIAERGLHVDLEHARWRRMPGLVDHQSRAKVTSHEFSRWLEAHPSASMAERQAMLDNGVPVELSDGGTMGGDDVDYGGGGSPIDDDYAPGTLPSVAQLTSNLLADGASQAELEVRARADDAAPAATPASGKKHGHSTKVNQSSTWNTARPSVMALQARQLGAVGHILMAPGAACMECAREGATPRGPPVVACMECGAVHEDPVSARLLCEHHDRERHHVWAGLEHRRFASAAAVLPTDPSPLPVMSGSTMPATEAIARDGAHVLVQLAPNEFVRIREGVQGVESIGALCARHLLSTWARHDHSLPPSCAALRVHMIMAECSKCGEVGTCVPWIPHGPEDKHKRFLDVFTSTGELQSVHLACRAP